jgi:8-oxo-dGTP pyrophosphatase MutT (NUDIX family)
MMGSGCRSSRPGPRRRPRRHRRCRSGGRARRRLRPGRCGGRGRAARGGLGAVAVARRRRRPAAQRRQRASAGSEPFGTARARSARPSAARECEERVYVHRRAATKLVMPGLHDCWAGGVVGPGEEPAATAARELAEELGVVGVPLTSLFTLVYDEGEGGLRSHVYAFEARYETMALRCPPPGTRGARPAPRSRRAGHAAGRGSGRRTGRPGRSRRVPGRPRRAWPGPRR